VDATALVDGLDYYGCDGRPWDLQTDARWKKSGTESGRGMTLLGNGERYLAIARRKGVKSLWLAENHNMSADMLPAMDVEEPDRNMRIIATHVKQYLQG